LVHKATRVFRDPLDRRGILATLAPRVLRVYREPQETLGRRVLRESKGSQGRLGLKALKVTRETPDPKDQQALLVLLICFLLRWTKPTTAWVLIRQCPQSHSMLLEIR
jgi:hypothetical protein